MFLDDLKNHLNFWFNPTHSLFFIWQYWKLFRYASFFDNVEKNPLTKKQRQAIILDESRNLIVAGAGTGKTSTVVGKIGYLLEAKKAKPDEILVIAYNKNAANELKNRAQELIGVPIQVGTFHAIGRTIVKKAKLPSKPAAFIEQSEKLRQFIASLTEDCLKDAATLKLYNKFFTIFEVPHLDEHKDFKTLSEYSRWVRTNNSLLTLNGEKVKSYGELLIANFLFINGVSYVYESEYFHTLNIRAERFYRPDFYLPSCGCFIEYFGTDENGRTAPFIDEKKYNDDIAWKRRTHKYHGTDLIEVYYHQNRDGKLLGCLKSELIKRNVTFNPKSQEEIFETIILTKKHEHFTDLLIRFLTQFKENQDTSNVDQLRSKSNGNERSLLFLTLFEIILNRYQAALTATGEIDFGDMISNATHLIKTNKFVGDWKYILIDEFQDISEGRYELVRALLDQSPTTKLFCVGDDWQAIYRFAGSNHLIMSNFNKIFDGGSILKLDQTFRFNNQIAKTSSKFVTKNPSQIIKALRTPIQKDDPQVFLHWTESADTSDSVLKTIELIQGINTISDRSLQILTRYNRSKLSDVEMLRVKEAWNGPVMRQRTIHASKGLEADFVILLDLNSEHNGFPSSRENDPILNLVLSKPDDFPDSEERRLFYVSLTRAKEQTHLLANSRHPSSFAEELQHSEYNIIATGMRETKLKCPSCSDGRIIERTYNESLFFSCSNHPICGYKAAKCSSCNESPIERVRTPTGLHYACCANEKCQKEYEVCDKCIDGILVEKPSPFGSFLGCHTYQMSKCGGKKDLPTVSPLILSNAEL